MPDVNECEKPGEVTFCGNNGYCVNTYGSYTCGMDTKRALTIGMYVYSDQSINKLPILFYFSF
jgi:hypothetical protein